MRLKWTGRGRRGESCGLYDLAGAHHDGKTRVRRQFFNGLLARAHGPRPACRPAAPPARQSIRCVPPSRWREPRHDDHRLDTHAVRVVGGALRMIAGAHGDDATRSFVIGQQEQLIASAPLLKRTGVLEVLEFQVDAAVCQLGEQLRLHARGPCNPPFQAPRGLLDLRKVQHVSPRGHADRMQPVTRDSKG